MKLLRVHVISADTCGGLLDGLDLWLRSPWSDYSVFDPLCLVGPNGAGKSQFLQVLAEIFQSIFHTCVITEERIEGNPDIQFELEYLIQPDKEDNPVHVRISRQSTGKQRPTLVIQWKDEFDWIDCDLNDLNTQNLLPKKIVGYTSGNNETLSLPFLVSRSGYATDVREKALSEVIAHEPIFDTRLMLIDYGTNLEVLVANLLMGNATQREALLQDARLKDLHSFRCVIQLAHGAAPKGNRSQGAKKAKQNPLLDNEKSAQLDFQSQITRKKIQLTQELEIYLDNLCRCATCYTYDNETETYILDYWINEQTKTAFHFFWDNALALYSSLHKIAMLNDLVIPKKARDRFRNATKRRQFASRLPEPQDEDKVFRFEEVRFVSRTVNEVVEYVSLSDGEHQLGQILGTLSMLSFPDVLFLLDEPESHFNPLWRVKFISRVLDLPTNEGFRRSQSNASKQECLLTTHSPFVPSDMPRDKVFIFSKKDGKVDVRHPDIETYGTTFDTILDECFGVRPPISDNARKEIKELMHSDDTEEIKEGINRLGHSVEKMLLADRLRQLMKKE